MNIYLRLITYLKTLRGNKANMNEMDYGIWNEWDRLWTEGNKNETWSMKLALK